MCNAMTTLERLRRRRKPVARTVVLLVSWVWLSASASPCLGMVADGAEQTQHGGTHHDGGASGPDDAATGHGGHCPHCPPAAAGDEPAASHISCSTADDRTNDNGRSSAPKWSIKYASLAPVIVASRPVAMLPFGRVSRGDAAAAKPPLSLSLRYCVFLN